MTHFPVSAFIQIWADKIFMIGKLDHTIQSKMLIYSYKIQWLEVRHF